jgi:RNA polymerase sigma-70 factor (ECF subfamily)
MDEISLRPTLAAPSAPQTSEPETLEPESLDLGPAAEHETTRLMRAVKAGDRAAFESLVTAVRRRAFHVAASLVGSRDDALELCQEAFLKVYRARATYKDGEPFLPWFHRILRNTCFSFLRSAKRLRAASLDADDVDEARGAWEIAAEDEGLATRLERLELAERFRHALERLSARDREILCLRHFDELSYRDIARALGVPEGTVMSRLFHARRRLRDVVGDDFALELAENSRPLDPTRARTEGARPG